MDRKSYQQQIKLARKNTHRRIEIQLTTEEFASFERMAKIDWISVNSLIKNIALAGRDRINLVPGHVKESLDDLSKLIRNIADNINQIAHRSNIFQDVDENQVFQHLANLDTHIRSYIERKTQ